MCKAIWKIALLWTGYSKEPTAFSLCRTSGRLATIARFSRARRLLTRQRQPPGADASDATIPLKVYDTQDPTAEQAPFLGTEILIREGLYHGQPCPQEGLEEYELLPNGYYACHHYG